jgi:hypothetical protein
LAVGLQNPHSIVFPLAQKLWVSPKRDKTVHGFLQKKRAVKNGKRRQRKKKETKTGGKIEKEKEKQFSKGESK